MMRYKDQPSTNTSGGRLHESQARDIGNETASLHERQDRVNLKCNGGCKHCEAPGDLPGDMVLRLSVCTEEVKSGEEQEYSQEHRARRVPLDSLLQDRRQPAMSNCISGYMTVF